MKLACLLSILSLIGCGSPHSSPLRVSQQAVGFKGGAPVPLQGPLGKHLVTLIRASDRTAGNLTLDERCQTVILAPDLVLTAGHCLTQKNPDGSRTPYPPKQFFIYMDNLEDPTQVSPFSMIWVKSYRLYKGPPSGDGLMPDLALVRLQAKLTAPYARAEILEDVPLISEQITLAGSGMNEIVPGGPPFCCFLTSTQVLALTTSDFHQRAAVRIPSNVQAVQGDSGGVGFQETAGGSKVWGTLSGRSDAESDVVVVWDVRKFKGWMTKAAKELGVTLQL